MKKMPTATFNMLLVLNLILEKEIQMEMEYLIKKIIVQIFLD